MIIQYQSKINEVMISPKVRTNRTKLSNILSNPQVNEKKPYLLTMRRKSMVAYSTIAKILKPPLANKPD